MFLCLSSNSPLPATALAKPSNIYCPYGCLCQKGLLVSFMRFNKGVALSYNNVYQIFGFVLFIGFLNDFHKKFGIILGLMLLFRMAYIIVHIAALTGFIIKFLTKIMKNELSSGNRRFGKCYYFLQQGMPNFLF